MKDDVQSHPSLFENLDGGRDQFRLSRVQTFNWGTFPGVLDMSIPEKGFLLVGPSGSGKSTILDAHTTLLTPPKWLDFNAAAGESGKERFRNIISYVRGAWSNNTGDSGEQVTRYVRTGTTWSVIAETYANGHGAVVVLAQIFYLKGSSNANTDVKKLYLVLDRPFDVKELKFFADSEFDVRKLKHELADAHIKEEFSAYQTVFRDRLGIGSERALRLLHKTQSAKHLGDLPVFLRDFMLDLPETFEVADQLVLEFGELNAAHQAVVAAENQIATLAPARDDHTRMEEAQVSLTDIKELEAGLDGYREQRRKALLADVITQLKVDIEGSKQEERRLQERATEEADTLRELKDRRHAQGGGTLARLEQEIDTAEQEKPVRLQKQAQAREAATKLGQVLPDNATGFTQLVHTAKQRVLQASDMARELERRKDILKADVRDRSSEFRAALDEVRAMEEQQSNIPSRMLAVRAALAREIGVAEENLPFAGELIEVKPEAAEWQGAIERVLNGFAQSLLVDDRYYASVSSFLNANNIGTRLVYFRVNRQTRQAEAPRPSALIHKLALANTLFKDWLREELKLHFDYECAETLAAFRLSSKAITREGQVKHSATRHEKNDSFRIDDRSRWVLGFDNKAKLELFKRRAGELGAEIEGLNQQLRLADAEEEEQRQALLHSQTLANLVWSDIDVGSLLHRIAQLQERLEAEKAAHPDLAKLDETIEKQGKASERAEKAWRDQRVTTSRHESDLTTAERQLQGLRDELLNVALTPFQQSGLDQRFAAMDRPLTRETLSDIATSVTRVLSNERSGFEQIISNMRHAIENRFAEFNRNWPADSGGLDPTMASAGDYFRKLSNLEADGLPRFKERFFQLLSDQSDQNLTRLRTRIDHERKAILDRLELVNESLLTAEFNSGTHLVIECHERPLEEVKLFKQQLREALSQSFDRDPEVMERRFKVLSALVTRLRSQETEDRRWRATVLDVRQHVDFIAKEYDKDGVEIEVYINGGGKSGGQRQKLTTTCLGAALRYQLGGQDRTLPVFSTVVLDEAFDKADPEFTTMAMNIFTTFGFQMVVATPLKSVMTLEPFIGGAAFVQIKDRNQSSVQPIEYLPNERRLKATMTADAE